MFLQNREYFIEILPLTFDLKKNWKILKPKRSFLHFSQIPNGETVKATWSNWVMFRNYWWDIERGKRESKTRWKTRELWDTEYFRFYWIPDGRNFFRKTWIFWYLTYWDSTLVVAYYPWQKSFLASKNTVQVLSISQELSSPKPWKWVLWMRIGKASDSLLLQLFEQNRKIDKLKPPFFILRKFPNC